MILALFSEQFGILVFTIRVQRIKSLYIVLLRMDRKHGKFSGQQRLHTAVDHVKTVNHRLGVDAFLITAV